MEESLSGLPQHGASDYVLAELETSETPYSKYSLFFNKNFPHMPIYEAELTSRGGKFRASILIMNLRIESHKEFLSKDEALGYIYTIAYNYLVVLVDEYYENLRANSVKKKADLRTQGVVKHGKASSRRGQLEDGLDRNNTKSLDTLSMDSFNTSLTSRDSNTMSFECLGSSFASFGHISNSSEATKPRENVRADDISPSNCKNNLCPESNSTDGMETDIKQKKVPSKARYNRKLETKLQNRHESNSDHKTRPRSSLARGSGIANNANTSADNSSIIKFGKNAGIIYSTFVYEFCVQHSIVFPEYVFDRQNGVFLCQAEFMNEVFTSKYAFDKNGAKEDACRLIYNYVKSNKEVLLSHAKMAPKSESILLSSSNAFESCDEVYSDADAPSCHQNSVLSNERVGPHKRKERAKAHNRKFDFDDASQSFDLSVSRNLSEQWSNFGVNNMSIKSNAEDGKRKKKEYTFDDLFNN